MRYAVLILALLGVAATGVLGIQGYLAANDAENKKAYESNRAQAAKNPLAKELAEKEEKRGLAVYCLLGTAVLGLAGGILAFMRKKYIAIPLLLLPGIAPAVVIMGVDQKAGSGMLIFSSPLFLAGLLSFAIRTKPKTASVDEGTDEEEAQPQRSGKRALMEVKKVGKKPGHAAPDEDAEAAFAALEMEGDEAETMLEKRGEKSEEEDIDLEAAAVEEEEQVDLEEAAEPEEEEPIAPETAAAEEEQVALETAAAEESEQVDPETAAAEEDERVDLESAVAPEEETSDHEAVAAPEEAEAEAESTAALFEEEEPAAPEWIDKFVCPSCDTYLKSSAPLPLGKPFNCPKCRDAVTVTARA